MPFFTLHASTIIKLLRAMTRPLCRVLGLPLITPMRGILIELAIASPEAIAHRLAISIYNRFINLPDGHRTGERARHERWQWHSHRAGVKDWTSNGHHVFNATYYNVLADPVARATEDLIGGCIPHTMHHNWPSLVDGIITNKHLHSYSLHYSRKLCASQGMASRYLALTILAPIHHQ
jgi:hypothetical protein